MSTASAWRGPVNATSGIFHVVDGTDVLWVQTYGESPGAGSLEKTRAVMDQVFAQYKAARKSRSDGQFTGAASQRRRTGDRRRSRSRDRDPGRSG